jgi:uncharacterized protein YbcI
VAEYPKVFDHVGLLVNKPPGQAGLPFVSSSDHIQSGFDNREDLCVSSPLSRIVPRKKDKASGLLVSGVVSWISMTREQTIRAWSLRRPGRASRRAAMSGDASEVPVKTQGEIEATICQGMTRFEQEYMGRGPKDIRTHLIDDLVVVRLQGVLTAAEQHLVKSLPAEKGRDLLKQVRTHLLEVARPRMEAMVRDITGITVISLHHDISTKTGEEVVLFTLAESPQFREVKKKSNS